MDQESIDLLYSLQPQELWDLYIQSQQVRDYVNTDYFLYSKFWYGTVKMWTPRDTCNHDPKTDIVKISGKHFIICQRGCYLDHHHTLGCGGTPYEYVKDDPRGKVITKSLWNGYDNT